MRIYARIHAYCVSCHCFFFQFYELKNDGEYRWFPTREKPATFVEFDRWIKCGKKHHQFEYAKFDESDLNGHNSKH